jgi:putative ABC transport system permease protein
VLSAVGASGAIADTVARRSHEIALRSALGASRRSIARQVLTSGVRLAIIGAVVGLVIFATVSLFTEPLPSGARGPGGWWWILTPVGLIVVVLLGGAGPVRRALNIDPASLLRE